MNVDVLIAGGGPAGLAAAIELRRAGAGRVLVADREEVPGGVPRHCQHTGFGLRDLRRVMSGPAYARHYAAVAAQAGAEIRAATSVTGWADGGWADSGWADGGVAESRRAEGEGAEGRATAGGVAGARVARPHTLTLTSARGIETVRAAAILLATGCRERPRPARLVPGARVPGIMTTGELQQRVYLGGQRMPGRAVIVGAEHVSFSALVTLAHAGAEVVALVTEHPAQQSYRAFPVLARLRWHTPVWTDTSVSRVVGQQRLSGVELADTRTGVSKFVPCDMLVFTGDWVPDHELARMGGLAMDPGTAGPGVDTALETSSPLVFAAGNLIHPAETADVAALSGRHAARQIAAALAGSRSPASAQVPLTVVPPLAWISPSIIRPATPPPRGRFLLRCDSPRRAARIEVHQGGRLLARSRPRRLIPGRPVHLPGGWAAETDPAAGPVRVLLS
jgi:thioredoxin reductase